MMNQVQKAASLLGKMAKGKKKKLSDKERQARSLRFSEARKLRWAKSNENDQNTNIH